MRTLARSPWFSLTAILTIALGIGANATIFSIADRVLLRPLPYREPGRLVWIASIHSARGQYSKSSGWDFNAWKEQSALFESVEAYWDRGYTITGAAYPEALVGWQFTPTLFATLGASRRSAGRSHREEGLSGRDNVVVLSDALWRRRFDGASDVDRPHPSARWTGLHHHRRHATELRPSLLHRPVVDAADRDAGSPDGPQAARAAGVARLGKGSPGRALKQR